MGFEAANAAESEYSIDAIRLIEPSTRMAQEYLHIHERFFSSEKARVSHECLPLYPTLADFIGRPREPEEVDPDSDSSSESASTDSDEDSSSGGDEVEMDMAVDR
jgi:hypothetical protein